MPFLVRAPAPVDAADAQLRALLADRFHSFRQWRTPYTEGRLATLTQLRHTLDQLLPLLTGARDFAGAAKVLSVVYHRFSLAPALCVQTSLEILRRHPEHHDDLLQFYLAALQEDRLDKRLLLKELWMFYVIQGDFYEAYALYKDEIQSLEVQEDPRLLANFGILCYWLLFIESSELRDKFKREDEPDDDSEDEDGEDDEDVTNEAKKTDDSDVDAGDGSMASDGDDDDYDAMRFPSSVGRKRPSRQQGSSSFRFSQWSQGTATPQSVEALIESKFAFKASIGVHILYQEAAAALRRAVSLCPTSAQFTEYYVQLLVLVGEINTACDYLENFYHLNPSDPHACRMLAGFLAVYYPESTDMQISVYLRWLKNDPASSYALEKIVDLASAGSISSIDLVHTLVEGVDACGGDLYLSKAPSVCVALWRHLAQQLAAMKDEAAVVSDSEDAEWAAALGELDKIGAARGWWKRAYFAHPADQHEAAAMLFAKNRDDDDDRAVETLVYRAAVAHQLFGAATPIVQALCGAVDQSEGKAVVIKPEHLRLFKSFFSTEDVSAILTAVSAQSATRVRFRDAPFRHIVHRVEPSAESLAEFKGGQLTGVRVMKRTDVITTDASSTRPCTRVEVTAENALHPIDHELVAALEEAVRDEEFAQEMEEQYHKTRSQAAPALVSASSNSSGKNRKLAVPMYVSLIEEAGYKDREAPINHLYTFVVESLHKLSSHNVVVPTLLEVESAYQMLLERWQRNEFVHGHPGLLLRYEVFLAKFVQPHVHAWIRRREQTFEPTSAMVDDAMAQMRTYVSGTHAHFPTRHEVDIVLRVKAASLVRLRRKLLRDFRRSMKAVLRKLVFLETRELASLAMEVCNTNGYGGCVTLEDLVNAAVLSQLRVYQEAILKLPRVLRMLARNTIDSIEDWDANDEATVSHLIATFKAKHPTHRPSRRRLRACVWLRKYELKSGPLPLENLWEFANVVRIDASDRNTNSVSNRDEREQEAQGDEGDDGNENGEKEVDDGGR